VSFWSWLKGSPPDGITPNSTVESPESVGPNYTPGDPDGFEVVGDTTYSRSAMPLPVPSPWDGWPQQWGVPDWSNPKLTTLVDTAWDCIDLNASVLSAMPVYRLKAGVVISPLSWMKNPDPTIYSSWGEFAKQLFWDFQLGEAFVMATDYYANGYPKRFRVMPPWAFKVEMDGGRRRYWIGSVNVTDDVLHIRYKSTSDGAHGVGPLESAGARLTTAGVLQRQMDEVARNGGVPPYILEVARRLTPDEANEVLGAWQDSRSRAGAGAPALATGGTNAKAMQVPSPKDMALLELAQFTEARIAVKLGVPPFLVGLPSGGDSMTYSNVSSLFDFHDRSSLKVKASHVMSALSWWSLPGDESIEMNRDEYTRPSLLDRANAYKALNEINALSGEEARAMERLHGDVAASALTGGNEGE
jgi:HK97 family phage portal protein